MNAGSDSRVWFITGATSGIGKSMALAVLEMGERVAVTARDAARLDGVFQNSDNVLPLSLEVADADQCQRAVAETLRAFGRFDVLVNNAGHGMIGAVEEVSDAEAKLVFESNFFGLLNMVRAVLPTFRSAKSGYIVNIGSVGGICSRAGMGLYSATKFAVEAITESLAMELEPLGIGAMVVEPGPFRTDFLGRSMFQSEIMVDAYNETAGVWRNAIAGRDGTQQGDPDKAARAIIEAVNAPNPPLHFVLGNPAMEMAKDKLDALSAEIERWRDLSAATDFD